jgi:hypothetical protein
LVSVVVGRFLKTGVFAMLSTNFECVYTEMDYGWSGIHFSDESRMDGRYRTEMVDAISQWRDMHPDRMMRSIHFMDKSTTPRGVNIYWDERDGGVVARHAAFGISDPACVYCFEPKDVMDWLVTAFEFVLDSDISFDTRDVIVSPSGIAATFSICKGVAIAFHHSKLIHYLGPEKMLDLQLFLDGEFADPTIPYVQLKFPYEARF